MFSWSEVDDVISYRIKSLASGSLSFANSQASNLICVTAFVQHISNITNTALNGLCQELSIQIPVPNKRIAHTQKIGDTLLTDCLLHYAVASVRFFIQLSYHSRNETHQWLAFTSLHEFH